MSQAHGGSRFLTRPLAAIVLLLGGTVIGLVLLETALRVGGWAYLRQVRSSGRPAEGETIRVLCLGESTTALGGERSYPRQLERILNRPGAPVRYRVINGGIPGVDTDDILDVLPAYLSEHRPHLVVAMMGINDFLPRPPSPLADLVRSLRTWKLLRLVWHRIVGVNALAILPTPPPPPQGAAERSGPVKGAPPSGIEADYERAKELAARGETAAAIELFNAIIAARPDFRKAYDRLDKIYRDAGRYEEAAAMQRRYPAEAAPATAAAANATLRRHDPAVEEQLDRAAAHLAEAAEENFDRATEALAAAPVHPGVAIDRARLRALADQAARTVHPYRLERVLGALGMFCLRAGESAAAEEFLQAAERQRLRVQNPMTVANYRILCRTLAERNLPLVAVGYAMRGIAPLRLILGPFADSTTLVENGPLFRDALRRESVKAIFDDLFGGDFGHGSPRGNEILAGHVAEAVERAAAANRPEG